MSTDREEFGVPVIFDVTAYNREAAGEALVKILAGHQLPGNRTDVPGLGHANIESWWTLEAIDKQLDRNDNDAGIVIFDADLDYLLALLKNTRSQVDSVVDTERHDRLISYLTHRVGWEDFKEEPDGT